MALWERRGVLRLSVNQALMAGDSPVCRGPVPMPPQSIPALCHPGSMNVIPIAFEYPAPLLGEHNAVVFVDDTSPID